MSYSRWTDDPVWYTYWHVSRADKPWQNRRIGQEFCIMPAGSQHSYYIKYPEAKKNPEEAVHSVMLEEALDGQVLDEKDAARLLGYLKEWIADVDTDKELKD